MVCDKVEAGVAADLFAIVVAGPVSSSTPATPEAKACLIAKNVTFFDYPSPIRVSQVLSVV
jgi:hypothetical protein